jgi:hypothetical protein
MIRSLPTKLVDDYRKNGFTTLQNVFGPSECVQMAHEVSAVISRTDLISESNYRTLFRDSLFHGRVLEQIHPIIDISAIFHSISAALIDKEIPQLFLEKNPVTLFRDKLILKPPGSKGYAVHQDFSWWHNYAPEDMLTIGIAIDGSADENGPITFYRGSHSQVLLPVGEWRPLTDAELSPVSHLPQQVVHLAVGDLIVFHSLAVHWSAPNLSQSHRRMLYFSYIAGSDSSAYRDQFDNQFKQFQLKHGANWRFF